MNHKILDATLDLRGAIHEQIKSSFERSLENIEGANDQAVVQFERGLRAGFKQVMDLILATAEAA